MNILGGKVLTKPNFFMVGAPKCGTTAMSEYLRQHPNVYMSDPKEPGFFSNDVAPSACESLDEYLGLFSDATPNQSIIAEASTRYLWSKSAIHEIRKFEPEAKIMVMLRRPSDMVYAFHSELVKNGYESEPNFEKAWNLQTLRSKGESLPVGSRNYPLRLQYRWIGSLGTQVQSLLRVFPSDQVHFVLFDDFAQNTRLEYIRALKFLGLSDVGIKDFPKINENIEFKFQWLTLASRYLNKRLEPLWKGFKNFTGIRELGVLRTVDRFNSRAHSRPPLNSDFRRYLDDIFANEVMLLEEQIGKKLTHWRGETG
jgi:hypothetical protein